MPLMPKAAKGFMKSENPDMLISIFTKEKERVDVYNNAGFGWGPYWGWGWGGYSNVTSHTEGSLYIDIIDAKKKELVWQGKELALFQKLWIEKKSVYVNL